MFTPSRNESRLFFFNTWSKMLAQKPLLGLEEKASHIIALHPEYHRILSHPHMYLEYEFVPESGMANPFLHLSLHLTIAEQIDTNQPHGISNLFSKLHKKNTDEHTARHAILEILEDELWNAVNNQKTFDHQQYLQRISSLL
ncbi:MULTISPECIES: DUF1841 family protein [Candidatus Ichthyocystis]|uniref:DUF1841 family protein n=1 Tax=Candidatus Ichthyocystis hellenicum TaxID=1561003 RepID=A0A0S4M1M4_9BURK|nr:MULTISPECIES: DUF1841 family protein [Ichthyocystis]CUT16911.1 conserved hypothetical protein, DUF1841 family [Candidatus Ichthyocystis hellenicum]